MQLIYLSELFEVKYGVNFELNKMIMLEDGIPFVSRGSTNNGVVAFVQSIEDVIPNPAFTISVALSGSVMEAFYQTIPYYSGRDLCYLKPKQKLSSLQMLFYCACLRKNKDRYNYGRQANKTLKSIKIPHPHEVEKIVINYSSLNPPSKLAFLKNININLQDREWKYFKLDNIFDRIETGSYYPKDSYYIKGIVPLISAKDNNNGVLSFTNLHPNYNKGITIGKVNMSIFFQREPFCITSDVCVIIKNNLSDWAYLFVASVLKLDQFRWSYGRQIRLNDTKKIFIKLPIKQQNIGISEPDWQFMEDYIKSLPYSININL
jgi:hypothetical protein